MRSVSMMIGTFVFAGALVTLAPPVRADDAAQNYQRYCQKCHGEHGKGDGPGAAMLKPKPRDYTDCASMEKRADAELFKVISEGGEAIGMSADMQEWGGTLSDAEIHELVKYVRSFCKKP